MKRNFFEKLRNVSYKTWILLAIIVLGIFLRTYHFHSWLDFENDQVMEARLVRDVLQNHTEWPLLGPDMTGSGTSRNEIFHLGPVFYYFQILSAEIFGTNPAVPAYPVLFFAILALPLFYFFIRRYFTSNLSLVLTGLYAISFFSVQYSRFAWNPNLIPFFTLLFLASLHEFLIKRENVSWLWISCLGISLGIGFQLHAILMAVFPATLFFVFVYLFSKNKELWKKMAVVICITLVLNIPQGLSEMQTGFSNTRIFLRNFTVDGSTGKARKNSLPKIVANAFDCHIEANAYMVSAFGMDACPFSYVTLLKNSSAKATIRTKDISNSWNFLFCGFLFSFCGYLLLIFRTIREKETAKKYFLRLIALYLGISFLTMTIVVNAGFVDFRYFIHTFFLPFLFLGLLLECRPKKFFKIYISTVFIILLFIVMFNVTAIATNARELWHKNHSNEHFVILGEIEPMLQYMIADSAGQKEAQLAGDARYLSNFSRALQYIATEQNFTLIQISRPKKIIPQKTLFYITSATRNLSVTQEDGYQIESRHNFGQVSIYKLVN